MVLLPVIQGFARNAILMVMDESLIRCHFPLSIKVKCFVVVVFTDIIVPDLQKLPFYQERSQASYNAAVNSMKKPSRVSAIPI